MTVAEPPPARVVTEPDAPRARHRRIARGIYIDGDSYYVRAQACKRRKGKRYDLGTPMSEMKKWQRDQEDLFRKQAPPIGRGTLAADVVRYLKQVEYLASHASIRSELAAWTALYGHLRRAAIGPQQVRLAVVAWVQAGVKPKTIRNRVVALRRVYHVLGARPDAPDETPYTPCDGVRLPKPQKKRPVYVSPQTLKKVEAALRQQRPPRLTRHGEVSQHYLDAERTRARFMVLSACGMRPAQLKRMTRVQLDLHRRTITVEAAKDGEPVSLWLNDDMLAAWKLFDKVEAWGAFDTRSYGRALRRAGYPKDVRPYNVRHAVGQDLSEQGEDLEDISKWLGHSDTATTRAFYVPVLNSRMKRMSERLDGRLGWAKKVPRKGTTHRASGRKRKQDGSSR